MKRQWLDGTFNPRKRNRAKAFKRWLAMQLDRDDPMGDLANDAKRCPDWKATKISEYSDALGMLTRKRACYDAIETIEYAYREWELYRRMPNIGRIDWWADAELEGADYLAFVEADETNN